MTVWRVNSFLRFRRNIYGGAEVLTTQQLTSQSALTLWGVTAKEILRERIPLLLKRSPHKTQRDLVRAIGKSDAWLSDFLKGRSGVGLDALDDLARGLGVHVADLFADRDLPRQAARIQEVIDSQMIGGPDAPAARAKFVEALFNRTFDAVSSAILDLATPDAQKEPEPPQSPRPTNPAIHRTARTPRTSKVKGK